MFRVSGVLFAAAAWAALAAPAAAAPQAGPYRIQWVRPAHPLMASGRQVLLITARARGAHPWPTRLTVTPSMPAMPMGLATITARPLGQGRFRVPLVLTMPGLYRLAVRATGPAGSGTARLTVMAQNPLLAPPAVYAALAIAVALVLALGYWRLRLASESPGGPGRPSQG